MNRLSRPLSLPDRQSPSGKKRYVSTLSRRESGLSPVCFWGRRPGCNPPSVLSSICLIGEPAPPAEDHRRLLPLSHRCRDPFHPQPSILNVPRERTHHRHLSTGQGLVSAPLLRLSPGTSYGHNGLRHVGGVSSRPRPWSCDCSPARRLSQRYYHERAVQRASRRDIAPNVDPTWAQHLVQLGIAG